MTRTHDLLITNQLHYRLCYTSDPSIIMDICAFVKGFSEKSTTGEGEMPKNLFSRKSP